MRTVRIPLHSRKYPGLYALVDEADAELVNQYRWRPVVRKTTIYAYTQDRQDGKVVTIAMHRLLLGLTDSEQEGDHINHDGLDNRRANLRVATRQQNSFNRRANNGSLSRYKGVWRDKRWTKWTAQAKIAGKKYFLGRFDREEDAARAYDQFARKIYGEHAYLNFPDE